MADSHDIAGRSASVAIDTPADADHRKRFGSIFARSETQLSRLSIFALLYTAGFLHDLAEPWDWTRSPTTAALTLLIATVLLLQPSRLMLLFVAVSSTLYFFSFDFPDVANHVNLAILCNMSLIIGISWSYVSSTTSRSDDEFFASIEPILRLMIIITFTVAGFHKLNYDFLNPEVSCISAFGGTIFRMLGTSFVGMPAAVAIALVACCAGVLLWRQAARIPRIDLNAILVPGLTVLVVAVLLFFVAGASATSSIKNMLIFLIAVFVVCWQLIEGPLLLVRRFQWFALCLCLLVHAQLAMIGIVDFQALALALLFTFLPANVLAAWNQRRTINLLGVPMHRVHAYFLLNVFAVSMNGVTAHLNDFISATVLSGMLFNIGVLILLWPIVAGLFAEDRQWRWNGVSVLNGRTPPFLFIIPLLLLLFGMTSHLGLRTAGNFSMFSNLRTEGETSNHVLFGSNPLKFAGYQEDVVWVQEIDDATARIGPKYRDLQGLSLPVVEFKKLIVRWREAGRAVPMTFVYGGKTYVTDDVTKEPDWQIDGFDWEMRLLDFRVIQPDGPNRCRW